MLLFLPVILLVLTLGALGASNMQRGFRSSWLLALAGASLAWVSLLFLRFQLPLTVNLPFWWAGEGLEYPLIFGLDNFSWPLAFTICSLLVAALLGQVRQAVMASWVTWASGLTITSAGLLAAFSGDLLTFLFTWTLLDLLVIALQISGLRRAEERQHVLQQVSVLFIGSFVLFAAWIFSFYGQELAAILGFVSVSLRLGLWTPRPTWSSPPAVRKDLASVILLVPLAASLALLVRLEAIAEPGRTTFLLLALLPAAYAAGHLLLKADESQAHLWVLGQASLAAAAALGGQGQAALAFSLLLLLGQGFLPLVQQVPRFRFPISAAAVVLLCGLPLTAGYLGTGIYANWASPLILAFLPIQAVLLAGWLRRALQAPEEPLPAEPWMRTILWLGYATLPLVFIFLGLGLLPSFAAGDLSLPWWPAVATLAGAALLYFMFGRSDRQLHPWAQFAFDWIFSLRWLQVLATSLMGAIAWSLGFLSSLLEGHAGVLWALLFMALLLSLAGQYGLGS